MRIDLVPDDSLYRISWQQWLNELYHEPTYTDTMTRILIRWEAIYEYCAGKGDISEDDFIVVNRSLIGKFIGKKADVTGTAIERLRQSEQLYKGKGIHVISDGERHKQYLRLKAYDNVWYGKFAPYQDYKQWGGKRERKICANCHAFEGTMLHVTHSYDVCTSCGFVENEHTKEREV